MPIAPDETRLTLLAQIALEGVRMTPEAQELASMERLETILDAARYRSRYNRAQAEYGVERNADGTGPIVVGVAKFPTT